MLELVGKYNIESRQAFFGALADALANGESEIDVACMVGSLVRTPSVRSILEKADGDLEQLLSALNAKRRMAEEAAVSHPGQTPHFLKLPISPSGVAHGIPRETARAA